MMEWLTEVALKTGGPSAIRGAILGLTGFLLAKEGMLTHFGIVYDAAKHIISVNLDQLSTASIAALPALMAAVIKIMNYHGSQAVQTIKGDQPNA